MMAMTFLTEKQNATEVKTMHDTIRTPVTFSCVDGG
jgi:hypothetical protein